MRKEKLGVGERDNSNIAILRNNKDSEITDKQELKNKLFEKIDDLVDGVEKIGNINFFELGIKVVNGDIILNLVNTYKIK
jgi:hypothetical protein